MIWIKTEEENMTVTRFYLEIIGQAFERLNQKVMYISNIDEINPNPGDTVVVSTAPSVRKLANRKNVKIIYWAQGAWPEESYMRHASKIRFAITSWVEKAALKRADYVFFVSESMRAHYMKKYRIDFQNNYYIMPCANESFHSEAFENPDKYMDFVFCYAGATSVWQCFEETIELYAKIEERIPSSRLLLLVKDRELALRLLEKYGVKNYEIDFVTVDQLPERLSKVRFGFILRKPSVVNAVATPTKTLTYLSNGIIPIYSDCLEGISDIFRNCKYKIEVNEEIDLDSVIDMVKATVDAKDILEEYQSLYQQFYDRDKHILKIAEQLKQNGFA